MPRDRSSGQLTRAAPSMCGLAVKWNVHFLQRQPLLPPMDCFFVQRQRQGACCRVLWTDILCRWRVDSLRTNARRISLALSRRRTTRREYLNCSMLYVHIAACFTGKKLHSCVLQLLGGVTARSDLCPIRVQWLQAVFMRILVF